jgi:hypothetical protein
MAGPWGGKREKPKKQAGAPVGNVNRRASDFLPPARDVAERRAFLDALQEAEQTPNHDKAKTLVDIIFAKVASGAESMGVARLIKSLLATDRHRLTNARLDGFEAAMRREALKDDALSKAWGICGECDNCGERLDGVLRALEMALRQMGVTDGVDRKGKQASD